MPVYAYDVTPEVPCGQPASMPRIFSAPPAMIIISDIFLAIRHILLFPLVIWPFPRIGTDITIRGLALQIVALIASIIVTITLVVSFSSGLPTPWITVAFAFITIQAIQIGQGGSLLPPVPVPVPGSFPDEAWLFVNGVCTSTSGSRLIMSKLQQAFHRPIQGINNRTLGFLFDVLESLVQRDLSWPTKDLRTGYAQLCKAIINPAKTRVILIAHSQGAILASRWSDQLLADFPPATLAKLEIYTFASAANHFSAPSTGTPHAPFFHVEHFANEYDFFARIGVLAFSARPSTAVLKSAVGASTIPIIRARYAGRIFFRTGHTGHLLLSHYLNPADSILDDPLVREHSRLVEYIGGGTPLMAPLPNKPASSSGTSWISVNAADKDLV